MPACVFVRVREADEELKRRSGAHTEEEGGRENEDAWALHKENIILLPSPTLTDVISNGEKCRYKNVMIQPVHFYFLLITHVFCSSHFHLQKLEQ